MQRIVTRLAVFPNTNIQIDSFGVTLFLIRGLKMKNIYTLILTIFLLLISTNIMAQVVVIPLGENTKVSSYVMITNALPVPAGGTGGPEITPIVATLNVPATNARVKDINVFIDITHTNNSDLDVNLVHLASGINAELFTDIGGSGNNMRLQIDDDADVSVSELIFGPGLLRGWFKSESGFALDEFNGINPTGEWQLRVKDDLSGNTGMLNSWMLQISE